MVLGNGLLARYSAYNAAFIFADQCQGSADECGVEKWRDC